jgi:hypothetical protein
MPQSAGLASITIILQEPVTGLIGGVEIKSSLPAFERLDEAARRQIDADRWLNIVGGTSIGQRFGIYIDNTLELMWPPPVP